MRPVITAVVVSCAVSCTSPSMADHGGIWSAEAIPLRYTGPQREMEIASPDGNKRVEIAGSTISVVSDGRRLAGLENSGVSAPAEICWSPDSKAFAITESYGGAVGEWLVTVYILTESSVETVDVAGAAIDSFRTGFKCLTEETPNAGFASWINGSGELLLALEVPPHSSCPDMGTIKGYIVSVPSGTILQKVDSLTLRQKYAHLLGPRLKTD